MRVGFSTLFSYRPHVEHIFYLSQQFDSHGHETYYFNCNGGLPNCFNLEFKKGKNSIECAKCKIGSLYSYTNKNTTFIDNQIFGELDDHILREVIESSSYSITRIEDPADTESQEVKLVQQRLKDAVQITYANAKKWILDNKLDFVFFFNGRMDVTRAIMQACLDSNTQFCAVERTLFAHGLQLNFGGNCLSLKEIHSLSKEYINKPLNKEQALKAASLLTTRFRKSENLEWRNYNKDGHSVDNWPRSGTGKKILILPSSKSEVFGQYDWRNDWLEYPLAMEKVIEKLGGDYSNIILRGHPNWNQKIGHADGKKIIKYYQDWCSKKGIEFISSESKLLTSDLIDQADIVLLNGSSAVYEASILGTPTICVARCRYMYANIATMILSDQDLNDFNPEQFFNRSHEDILKYLLRFFYTYAVRYALFNQDIRALTIHKFKYSHQFDLPRLLTMMDKYNLIPDDLSFAVNEDEEEKFIHYIKQRKWNELEIAEHNLNNLYPIKRRGLYYFVDEIRELFKRGDI